MYSFSEFRVNEENDFQIPGSGALWVQKTNSNHLRNKKKKERKGENEFNRIILRIIALTQKGKEAAV